MTLYLLPNTLGYRDASLIPSKVGEIVAQLQGVIAESQKGGRSFLSLWREDSHRVPLAILNKQRMTQKDCDFYLEPLVNKQESWGLISDAGLPCIADPGMFLVRRARELGIVVKGISGTCSITQALMLSGLPGQNFSFLGYLPQAPKDRDRLIKGLISQKQKTYIFIETPYRNKYTFQAFLDVLPCHAELSVAIGLTGPEEFVDTNTIANWKTKTTSDLVYKRMVKTPTVFLFHIYH